LRSIVLRKAAHGRRVQARTLRVVLIVVVGHDDGV